MSKRTTKHHFEIFKEECLKWIEIFGMKDWEYVFTKGVDPGNRAQFLIDDVGRIVVLYFAEDWEDNVNDISEDEIRRVAFHEIAEVSLYGLYSLAEFTFRTEVVERETHKVVRMMEHAIFDTK